MTFAALSHSLYPANSIVRRRRTVAPKGKSLAASPRRSPMQSCPEALGSPSGCSVRSGHRLLWPHLSPWWPPNALFASSVRHLGRQGVPNLSCASVRTCRLQDPGGPDRCLRLLLLCPQWSSPSSQRLDTHSSRARWFPRGSCHEAVSSSLPLRPARLLALHQQGRLLPSFRRTGRPAPTSVITT